MTLIFANINTASIYWILLLCYYQAASGKIQEVHNQSIGTHRYHKIHLYQTWITENDVKHRNLNYARLKKREAPLINAKFLLNFDNMPNERAAITGNAEIMKNKDRQTSQLSNIMPFIKTFPTNESSTLKLRKLLNKSDSSGLDGSTSELYRTKLNNEGKGEILEDGKIHMSSIRQPGTSDNIMQFIGTQVYMNDSTALHENKSSTLGSCLETLCNKSEKTKIALYPERTAALLGSDVTFTCTLTTNATYEARIFWVHLKQNFSDTTTENNTILHFNQTKQSDSGIYKCVKWEQNDCCHMSVFLQVYNAPPYTMHLLIVGTAASISLLMCIAVEIWRSYRMRQYITFRDKAFGKGEQLLQKW